MLLFPSSVDYLLQMSFPPREIRTLTPSVVAQVNAWLFTRFIGTVQAFNVV